MEYYLMHKDIEVLELDIDEITGGIVGILKIVAKEHAPIGIGMEDGIVDRAALNHWWLGRSIPASRSGLRDALEKLQIATPQMLLTKCYGLSLSDQYWVRPANQPLQWSSINFFQNTFSEDVGNILFGVPASDGLNLMSPDNTSDGWLKKRWKVIGGERCLIKGGSAPFYQEPLNEVFASRLMAHLNIPHADYSLLWDGAQPYSVCPDFVTSSTELVSAHHICKVLEPAQGKTNYEHFLDCCHSLGIPGGEQALDEMLTVDFLIANEDRHWNNFGALRNADTLGWIGVAPIFDCGTSLWYDNLFRWGGPEKDVPSKPFAKSHAEQIQLVRSFDWLDFEKLASAAQEWESILNEAPRYIDDNRRQTLIDAFQGRVSALEQVVLEQRQEPQMEISM